MKVAIFIFMIYDITPYSIEKNLGLAYNQAIEGLPDGAHVCLRDGDCCWLTPDYGVILSEYVRMYPDAILTCWTNRINPKAEQQFRCDRECSDMKYFLERANALAKDPLSVTQIEGFVSGFCLVFSKELWSKYKFTEKQFYEDRGPYNLLGVDNEFTNRVRAAGVRVLRMDNLLMWHTYRLLTGDNNKSHLS